MTSSSPEDKLAETFKCGKGNGGTETEAQVSQLKVGPGLRSLVRVTAKARRCAATLASASSAFPPLRRSARRLRYIAERGRSPEDREVPS